VGFIEELVAEGTTVLLTTQYMEEAEHLADTIIVLDAGHIAASGTSDQLKDQLGEMSWRSGSPTGTTSTERSR